MQLSRNIFRCVHHQGQLVSRIHLKSFQQCVQRCLLSSSSSKLSSFKTPFAFYNEKSSSSSSSSSDGNDSDSEDLDNKRYVKQWLTQKEFQCQTIEDFKPYLKNDEELKKMEWILLEYELVKYDSSIVPSYLPPERVKEMMEIQNPEKLHSYFHFLYNRENRKNAEKLRRVGNRSEIAKALRKAHDNNVKLEMGIYFDSETGKPAYGKWRNSCFIDLGRKDEYTAWIPSNVAASQFGQKIIIDFDYEDCMLIQEKKSLTKQMCFAYQAIREAEEPFDPWFCNLNKNGRTYSLLEKAFGWDHQAKFTSHFIHRSPKSYLDLFADQLDKLVYLCPDSSHDFAKFDHDAIYIIGGLVDKSVVKPVSLAKCKREKIKNLRLPLDKYLSMLGSKVLTIDQVVTIMVNLKEGKSMEEALRYSVPERKLKSPEQVELERDRRLLRLNLQKNRNRKNLYY